jgi:hypothetical protein
MIVPTGATVAVADGALGHERQLDDGSTLSRLGTITILRHMISPRCELVKSRRPVWAHRHRELKHGAAGQVHARLQLSVVRFDTGAADRQAHPQAASLRSPELRGAVLP